MDEGGGGPMTVGEYFQNDLCLRLIPKIAPSQRQTEKERERERGLEREIVLTGSGYGDDGDPPVFGFPASSWNAIGNTDLLLFSPPSVCPSVRREGVRFLLQSSENSAR